MCSNACVVNEVLLLRRCDKAKTLLSIEKLHSPSSLSWVTPLHWCRPSANAITVMINATATSAAGIRERGRSAGAPLAGSCRPTIQSCRIAPTPLAGTQFPPLLGRQRTACAPAASVLQMRRDAEVAPVVLDAHELGFVEARLRPLAPGQERAKGPPLRRSKVVHSLTSAQQPPNGNHGGALASAITSKRRESISHVLPPPAANRRVRFSGNDHRRVGEHIKGAPQVSRDGACVLDRPAKPGRRGN